MQNKYDGDWPIPFFRPPPGFIRRAFLNRIINGLLKNFRNIETITIRRFDARNIITDLGKMCCITV